MIFVFWFHFQIGGWFCERLLGIKGIENKIDMGSMGRRRSELEYKELKICEQVLIGFIVICLAQVSLGATNQQDGESQPIFICWLRFLWLFVFPENVGTESIVGIQVLID
jgi:hypothetical protein